MTQKIVEQLEAIGRTLAGLEYPRSNTILELYRFTDTIRQCAELTLGIAVEMKKEHENKPDETPPAFDLVPRKTETEPEGLTNGATQ